MNEYISKQAAVDAGYLSDWYISSVGDEPPVWTDEHIEELLNDFIVFPKDTKAADVQPIVDTENMATVPDEFICKKCGIYLKDYIKVVMDEDNDGYIDEQHYDYEPKFCPECGAKVESCIKTPKRDKPLYTMDEICKMNGVEFSPRKDGDTNG